MRILRPKEICERYGYSKSNFYSAQQDGTFVRSVKIDGKRAAGIPEDEAEQIAAARVAGATDKQIRKLVDKLHEQRAAGMPELV